MVELSALRDMVGHVVFRSNVHHYMCEALPAEADAVQVAGVVHTAPVPAAQGVAVVA